MTTKFYINTQSAKSHTWSHKGYKKYNAQFQCLGNNEVFFGHSTTQWIKNK